MFRALLLALGVLGVSVPALAASSLVWFATGATIYQVDSLSNAIVRQVPIRGTGALATDGQQDLWVVTAGRLVKLGADGTPLTESDLGTLALKRDPLLAVDPHDDRLWLTDDTALVLLDSAGQRQASFPLPLPHVRQIRVGLDHSLWLLGNKRLQRLSAAGAIVSDLDLHEITKAVPRVFVVDDLTDVLWLGGEKELIQLDLATEKVIRSIESPAVVRGLALQPKTSTVWVATEDALLAYGVDGERLKDIDLRALAITGIERLAFDPIGDSLWLTHKAGVARFSVTGELLATIATPRRPEEIGTPPFTLQPQLALLEPANGTVTNNPTPRVLLQYDALCNDEPCGLPWADLPGFVLGAQLNGAEIGARFSQDLDSGRTAFLPGARLPEGLNIFAAQAQDDFGHLSNAVESTFTIDTIPPAITIDAPTDGSWTNRPVLSVSGRVSEPARLAVNGAPVALAPDHSFALQRTLQEGFNTFELRAADPAGNVGARVMTVTLDTEPPAAALRNLLTTAATGADGVTITGADGSVALGSRVRVTNRRTGESVEVDASSLGAFSTRLAGRAGDEFSIIVLDAAGNLSAPIALTLADDAAIPPDPASVAPANDPTVATQLASSTAFLYSGPNPIQTGVAPGTIEARRAIVLRGKILDRDNQPLSGVTVTVLGYPEVGRTRSRADGMFDMAANGGGYLTLDYQKAGYLPVQRTVQTPWRDYVVAPDVVMIALDPQATAVALGADSMQVARGSVVSDRDGTRQATLLFPRGTTATMVMPDGSTQTLGSITVRATEYTVGANGPEAMPGDLPPTSGYTYAAEYSVDEAIAAGATRVEFNQPIYQYVDNFLHFPVGGVVPVGWYDREKAAWVPSENGRVIQILSTADGIAEVDTDGDGQADDATRLAALNITIDERVQLGALYAPGTSLWRVPITHFTPWDCNWPYGPPSDAETPDVPEPEIPLPEDEPDCQSGSIIECQNQSLGESIPIAGTPFSLNYMSSRMPGRESRSMVIWLSGAVLPPSVKRIELEVAVAGQRFTESFPAGPDQIFKFSWDGLDAYGRSVQGMQTATVRIGYVYEVVYYGAGTAFSQSFSNFGNGIIAGDRARAEVTIWKESRTSLGNFEVPSTDLGGWSLDPVHIYGSNENMLYLGNGGTRSVDHLGRVITLRSYIWGPKGLALDPQGNPFIASGNVIQRLNSDAALESFYGIGVWGYSGDGGPAKTARFAGPNALAFDGKGNLYIADRGNARIRKIDAYGIVTTVAGNGSTDRSSDGGLAVETSIALTYPGLAADAQGAVYFSEAGYNRIRKITPNGVILTVAGNGTPGFSGDGGLATSAQLTNPRGLAVDRRGNLYFVDGSRGSGDRTERIRRVSPDGTIHTVAAPCAKAVGDDLAVDTLGNIYFACTDTDPRVYRLSPDRTITVIVGSGVRGVHTGYGGNDTVLATATPLVEVNGIEVDPQGDIHILEWGRIRSVSRSYPASIEYQTVVASSDASQLYLFDSTGRHHRTLWAATGAERYRFSYTPEGYLSEITDGDESITRIERSPSGLAAAIVAPGGQRTVLTLGPDGYLKSVANPADEVTRMTYHEGGLLATFTNARNKTSTMDYDASGRLIKDQNAANGFWNLTRSGEGLDYVVDMTSALSRMERYEVERLPTGGVRRTNIRPDGSGSVVLKKTDGTIQSVAADGTVTTVVNRPDPRFGMMSPFAASTSVQMPSGLSMNMSRTRQVMLSDPLDLSSLVTQRDTVTINGNTFLSVYDASLQQYTNTTPLNRQSVVKIDAQSRPLSVEVPGIETIKYSYDTRGRPASISQGTGAEQRITTFGYNLEGYVESITDALGRTTRYTYDAAGRTETITLPNSEIIGLTNDANGNVTSITPPGRPAHDFVYSPVDLPTDYIPPSLGGGPLATRYEYNVDKQPTRVSRPDGRAIEYGYDSFGRLMNLTVPAGVIEYGYTVDSGQLKSVTTPAGIGLDYRYDGALPTATTWSGPVAGEVSTAYDNFFRVSAIAVNGSEVRYSYDADGLLTAAGSLALTRDPLNGFVTDTALGQIATSQRYNRFGELSGIIVKYGATVLYDEQYTRDRVGRPVEKVVSTGGQTQHYGYDYDAAGRLTDVTLDGAPAGHFEYDANGNRTLADGVGATYDDQDRLETFGTVQYIYSANGELQRTVAGGASTSYEYDVFGNLTHVALPDGTQLDYLIDGQNRRIGKKINGALVQGFLYLDQLKPAVELDGQGNVVARFVYGGKPNVPEYMVRGGVTYRFVTDPLGSVRIVVNSANGEIVQRLDYDVWGKVLRDTNPGFQPFGFAGGLYDRHTGLVRFGARDYDPTTARWTAKDPIGFGGGDTGLYSYVEGNPISFIDPDGQNRVRAAAAAAAAALKYGKQVVKKGKEVWDDLNFDGPSPGLDYGNGRVCQVRYKKQPIFRMDYQPIPGSNNESRLHIHVPPNMNQHYTIDPRSFLD